ncbi:MAG: hypothetical protein J6W29_06050, partial [Neisseriaceae bacterium]|nr:hypothetical protein [Neisseriaceae bacterium]
LINADFVTATKTLGERFPINGDDYRKFENHQSKANFFYCFDTNEVVIFAESPSKNGHGFFNVENTEFYGLKDFVQELKQNQTLWQVERQRTEKREEVFNMIAASGVLNTAWNGDKTHGTESILDTPFITKSLYYQDGELVYKDANYQSFATPDIFKISKEDFEKYSPQAIALAVMKGVEEYRKIYNPAREPEQSAKKLKDLQYTVNVGLQQYDSMFKPEIQKISRLDILATQEKFRSERVSGSQKEQTAEKSGISSPENSVKFDDFGVVPENGNAMKIDTSLPIEEQYKQYQLAEEWISRQSTEASIAVQYLQGQKGFSGFNPERLEKAIAEESRLAKQLDDLRQANPEFALMARAKHLDPKDLTPELRNELQRVNEWVESQKQAAEIKQDAFGVPETPKTLNPKEQALKDGKALAAAEKKVSDARFDLAKQPNNTERQDAFKQAQAELAALNEEVKSRVQAAMNKGEPYIIRYDEVPAAPFNGEKAPIELVVTRSGNLRVAIGMNDTPHNLTAVDSTPEIALNAEQRSTPERTAEVLRERFNQPTAAIADQIACINYPNADKVFGKDEIKNALHRALKSSFKEHQLAAIKSPVMRGEWLEKLSTNQQAPEELRQIAKNEMAERYGTPEPTVEQTAEKSGFSFDDNTPQAKQSPQASTKDDELLKQLCKPDFALRKAALNDPEISVNLLKRVIDNHTCPQTRNVAKAVLEQRQGGGVGVSQPQSNTRSIAGATPKI